MRDAFFSTLFDRARNDANILVVSNDFGAPSLDRFRAELPGQFINAGISEQNMVSLAAGLTMGGKTVVVYSIATFVTLRSCEQIKIDLCAMRLPVTILGVGTGYAYNADGPTHNAMEDMAVMRAMAHMTVLSPSDAEVAKVCAERLPLAKGGPVYLRCDRGTWPALGEAETLVEKGLVPRRAGTDLALVATGGMVHRALDVASRLESEGLSTCVIDLARVKPIPMDLMALLASVAAVATMEEHTTHGGLGGAVAEFMADHNLVKPLRRLAIDDDHLYAYGARPTLHVQRGLDAEGATTTLRSWINDRRKSTP
ncbi:MAG: 1-deoxy-D-xylulose-5-phosphate synthase [Rhodospirillum sp.]|nr:1-deoxy-D-xylulose-5-phosphate synthase [Rhodospirillum sp.]MCF8487631.1 1-deoxy-D-xylulose-5-phosphate synthase [Rhodospirillum sp.]MCF8499235.1 1-deoxy-D-xylulose-5-phosphate synthase [Rhodospirillum sp.]